MNHSNRNPSRNEDLVTRHISGETVIVPVKGTMAGMDCVFTLNETGTRIWQLIDGKTSVAEIADQLRREFDVGRDVAEFKVREFVATLADANLIRLPGDTATAPGGASRRGEE